MKKSDIYEIAIKILGLYLVVIIIGQLKDVVSIATILIQTKNNPDTFSGLNQTPLLIVTLVCLLMLTSFSGLLIFKTRKLVRLISEKDDYEETTKLFTEKHTIYEIVLTLVGLLTIIQTLPEFAYKLNSYILIMQIDFPKNGNDKYFIIIAGLKITVGFLAIKYSKLISNYLTKDKIQNNISDE
ncbi:MAG: hypothetical protein ACOYO1_10525 [Bacteroidales bacterium]